ncbi:hypothetical protein ACHAXT_012796 [Thalassiosira profunda]
MKEGDPGLACLRSQLGQIDAQIRCLEEFKERVVAAEEACLRELEARKKPPATETGAGVAKSKSSNESDAMSAWVKKWDSEIGAEYFYNEVTGEASWLPPPSAPSLA